MRRIIVIVALLFAALLVLDAYPGLRGGAGWHWDYALPLNAMPVIMLALGLAVYVALAVYLRGRQTRAALAWAVMGGTALAYLVVGVRGDPFFLLFTRTVSPVQTGASALQSRIMAEEGVLPALQRWPQIMDEALGQNLIHFTTSPAGQVLLHQAVADIFDSPALAQPAQSFSAALRPFQCSDPDVMRYTRGEIVSAGFFGLLMPFFAAMAAIPLYLAARDLTDNRRLAADIAMWWPLIPAALMFAPTWNTVYPAFCLLAFWLLLRGLKGARGGAFGAGLTMAAATMLNFSVMPFFLFAGLFTLGWHFLLPSVNGVARRLRDSVAVGLVFGAGLLIPWLIYALITGVSPLDIVSRTFHAHGELVQREYLPWLILHPYDVLLFTGLPAAILALVGFVNAVRLRRFDPLTVFTLAMGLMVLLVNLAGIVQGENARILIFYMPFLLLMGLPALCDRPAGYDRPLLAAQALVLLAMAAVLAVVPLDLNPMRTAPAEDIITLGDGGWTDDGTVFVSDTYAGQFSLARYRWIADPSRQALTYEFQFTGDQPTERPYEFELIARADTDEGEAVSDPYRWYAQFGYYPSACWRAGDTIRDIVVMPLPPVPHPLRWEVTFRAIDPRTGDALPPHTLAPVPYP